MQACVVAVVRRGEDVLLGLRLKEDAAHGKLIFPGGRLEPGETFEEALARELGEETGLTLIQCLPVCSFAHGDNACMVYEVNALGDPRGGDDLAEPAFYPRTLLPGNELSDATKDLLIPAWNASWQSGQPLLLA